MTTTEKKQHAFRFGETDIGWLRRWRARILLSSFSGVPDDVYRAVHRLRDNEFFVLPYARDFFERTHRLLQSGRVAGVRRLFIYTTDDERMSELSRNIIAFHCTSPGYECRLIVGERYEAILSAFAINPLIDFGIFGRKRLYRARVDRPDHVIGTWTRRRREISRFVEAFDTAWREGERPSDNAPGMDLDTMFEGVGSRSGGAQ